MSDKTSDLPSNNQAAEHATDFTTHYANNILFESTAWDLKLTFGHLEKASNPILIQHDLAVTIPWPQAKLALFWLRLHVELAEQEVGVKIPIRKDLLPKELPEPLPVPPGTDAASMQRFRELYERVRAEFLTTV